jgi:hypothetical protein
MFDSKTYEKETKELFVKIEKNVKLGATQIKYLCAKLCFELLERKQLSYSMYNDKFFIPDLDSMKHEAIK